jgi:hypothetical protein
MQQALRKAAAATPSDDSDTPAAPASTAPAKPEVNPQDKARAALSTTPTATPEAKPAAEAPKAPTHDPMAELEALRRSNSDQGRRYKAMEAEMSELRKFREEQTKQAEQAKLKPYQAQHPMHQQSMQRIALAEAFEAATEGMDQQQRVQTAQRMGITNDDLKLKNEWKSHKEQVSQQMAADPDGFISQRAEQIAEQKFNDLFQRKIQEHQIRSQVHEHLNDPVVSQFRQQNPEDFKQALQAFDGNTEALANQVHMLHNLQKVQAEKEALAKRIEELEAQSGMVTEQRRLLKGNATITREPAGAQPVADPLSAARAWAKANNVTASITNHKFFAKLQELKAQNGKPQNA